MRTIDTTPVSVQEEQKSPEEPYLAYTAEWVTYVPDVSFGLELDLSGHGSASATLNCYDSSRVLYLDWYAINDDEQGLGYGKKLLRAVASEGIKYHADTMSGHFVSPASLGTFASVFGADNLRFSDRYSRAPIDISTSDALKEPDLYIASADLSDFKKPRVPKIAESSS